MLRPRTGLQGKRQGTCARGLNAALINSGSHPRNVRRQIIKVLKEAPECGLVLVVTWQVYLALAAQKCA
jgi:hypothetical protein